MQYLKADTVTEVLIGPVVAVGDGFTPITSLTIAGADEAEIIKHGATTVTAITGTLAAITSADGYYALDLVTGDVDTEGRLTILINDDSLCLPVRHDFMVVNANVFDSLFAAVTTDYLQTDTTQWLGTACATPTVNGVPEVDLTHVAGATTNVSTLATNVDAILTDTADMQPKLGTPAGASISADILVIDNFVDGLETTIGVLGAGLTDLGGMSTTMKGQIQTECDDALVSMNLDHLVGTATAIPAIPAGTYIDQMMDDGTASYDRTTDSLQAVRDHASTIKTDTATIAVDVAGLDGSAMRGTDNAALASVCTEARLTILASALTESYATDGATATLTQLLYMILSAVSEFSISGTTVTCKKLDGSTTSMTFTLDDGTNPTSRTRAT